MIKFTEEQKQFIYDNYKGLGNKELTELIKEKFKIELTYEQVKNFKNRHHLNSGLTGQFKKGYESWNKGKKWDDYMSEEAQERSRKTTFKKGNIPSNHREVGSERITKDGYIEIKIKEPNKWQLKHRYIYEKKYGKIPKGYNLIFLDGNRQNFELSNLKLVSKAEDLIMNKNKLFTNDKDITNTGTLIAKIIDKGNKLKNERL